MRQMPSSARIHHRSRHAVEGHRPIPSWRSHAPHGRGLTTKIHAIVVSATRLRHDALGYSVALSLTPGQAADITQAVPLLDRLEPEAFLADKGYDSDALVATLEERGIAPVIPPKANRCEPRKTDFALYRERNLVERFFGNLKQYRALATRYDKLANTFLAAVALVCVLFWLN